MGDDSLGGRFPWGTIPLGDDSPGGRFPWGTILLGDDSHREQTPRGLMVGDAALGSQRSRVRIPPPPRWGSLWGNFGLILGSLWGHLGVILGSFWGHLGIILGSLWDQFGIILGSIWDQFGVMLGSFLAVRTGRSPERGGRQNGQTLARLGPPDWRQLGSQIGGPARLARTPERPERQNARSITASQILRTQAQSSML